MKKNTKTKYWFDFIVIFIAFMTSEKVSDYLGISNSKFFSLDTLLSFVIVTIAFVIIDLPIFKIIDVRDRQKNSDK